MVTNGTGWPSISTHKPWPPMEKIKRDRDAARWFNSRFTTCSSLFHSLCYFLTTGWPPEALDDFLDSIVPKSGWSDCSVTKEGIRMPHSPDCRRERTAYGPNFMALQYGYWKPSK